MKKIFTLLFTFVAFASAFAQQRNWDDHAGQNYPNVKTYPPVVYNQERVPDHERNDGYHQPVRYNTINYAQRDMQIARINRDIDFRIQQISYDRFMSGRQKRRAIEALQAQRVQQLQSCNNQYANYNQVYGKGDHDSRDNQNRNWNR